MADQPARLTTSTEHRWPDAEDGPWLVTCTWHPIDGRPECVQISIASTTGAVVTSSMLRKLPVGEWIATDRAAMTPRSAPAGLRRSTLDRLTEAAEVYQQAIRDRRPPTKAVAEHFGLSHGGAANLVSRARTAGVLPQTSPGVPTG